MHARLRANRSERLTTETDDQRAARLARVSANRSERLATETDDQRAARLARLRVKGLNEEHRAARLARLSPRPSQLSTPLLEQRPVHTEML